MSPTDPATLTNRQLAMAAALLKLTGEHAVRLQRDALEAGALWHLALTYRRLLNELAGQARITLPALPGNATELLSALARDEVDVGGAHQCQRLERSGWLADMLAAAARAASLLPTTEKMRPQVAEDVIAVSADPEPQMPLSEWHAALRALIVELRETSVEW